MENCLFQNTYDSKKDEDEKEDEFDMATIEIPSEELLPPEDCESCTI